MKTREIPTGYGRLVKYAVDKAYAGEHRVYHAIRGISPKDFDKWEELYYLGRI